MKKYLCSLLSMLVLSSLLVASGGAYIKYEILEPMDLYQDKSIMELPFLLATDDALIYMMRQYAEPSEPTEPSAPEETEAPEVTQPPTDAPTEAPTEPPTEPPRAAKPDLEVVEESWFDDVLFIGNSLGVGLRDYAPLGEADYFTVIGMTVFNARTSWSHINGVGSTNLERILSSKEYGKIYIHLGTNECGYPMESIVSAYEDLVDYIREYQPDASIVIQATMTFGRLKARQYRYMVPETIEKLNEQLRILAEEKELYFSDFNPIVADDEGYLPDEWSGDGCHPTVEGYRQWSRWILHSAGTLGIPSEGDD